MSDYGVFRIKLAHRILAEKLSPDQAAAVLESEIASGRFSEYYPAMRKEVKEWKGTAHWRDVSCPRV